MVSENESRTTHATMAFSAFKHPKIDWDAADLYQEFETFRSHIDFVFDGPLSELEAKQRAGWLGTWIGKQGREIYRMLNWEDGHAVKTLSAADTDSRNLNQVPKMWETPPTSVEPRKVSSTGLYVFLLLQTKPLCSSVSQPWHELSECGAS